MLKAHTDHSPKLIWMQLQGSIVRVILLGVVNAALMENHKSTCVESFVEEKYRQQCFVNFQCSKQKT